MRVRLFLTRVEYSAKLANLPTWFPRRTFVAYAKSFSESDRGDRSNSCGARLAGAVRHARPRLYLFPFLLFFSISTSLTSEFALSVLHVARNVDRKLWRRARPPSFPLAPFSSFSGCARCFPSGRRDIVSSTSSTSNRTRAAIRHRASAVFHPVSAHRSRWRYVPVSISPTASRGLDSAESYHRDRKFCM